LTEMQLDTSKHARIFKELLNTVEKAPPVHLWDYRIASYVDSLVVKKALESHLKVELKMLKEVEKIIKATKDEALKLLLEHIAADERKHHEIIQTILRKSYVLTK
jgi:rubrerythrin